MPAAQTHASSPEVEAFFHAPTFTVTYLVWDRETKDGAVIDSVFDFDAKSGRSGAHSAQAVLDAAKAKGVRIGLILETHAHADHLSAAPFLKKATGARIGIGAKITTVQEVFKKVFNLTDLTPDGRPFDLLLEDGARIPLGSLDIEIIATPGHTPACVSYKIGDAVFVGDTLFMPDYGTARADFPGGDARTLYRSVQRILSLPAETRLFMCHDYKAPGRDVFLWESTVAEERARNEHVRQGVSEDEFVAMREARDKTLEMPVLIVPSIQVNIRAGELPTPEANGVRYLKVPIDAL
ncbi:MAG: MBL fold metallo-hydrolase [Hyphomonadaceae bacterium]